MSRALSVNLDRALVRRSRSAGPGSMTQEESVYNLVPSEQTSRARPARYVSKVRLGFWEGIELTLQDCQGLHTRALVQHEGAIAPENFTVGVRHKQQAATFGMPDGCAAQAPDQFLQSRTVPFHQTQRGKRGSHFCHRDHQLLS